LTLTFLPTSDEILQESTSMSHHISGLSSEYCCNSYWCIWGRKSTNIKGRKRRGKL